VTHQLVLLIGELLMDEIKLILQQKPAEKNLGRVAVEREMLRGKRLAGVDLLVGHVDAHGDVTGLDNPDDAGVGLGLGLADDGKGSRDRVGAEEVVVEDDEVLASLGGGGGGCGGSRGEDMLRWSAVGSWLCFDAVAPRRCAARKKGVDARYNMVWSWMRCWRMSEVERRSGR
jgi:hypothetical protein